MNILIIYATTEGQTRKIARFMENVLQNHGHQVVIADASDEPPSPEGFDAVIIGGSLHMHKYQSAVAHYIAQHLESLKHIPGAFFSVCLAVASDIEEEKHTAEKITADFLRDASWNPLMTTQVAGALKYTEYDFFKLLIMKMISKREGRTTDTSQDYEYTDWPAVKLFVLDFVSKASSAVKIGLERQ